MLYTTMVFLDVNKIHVSLPDGILNGYGFMRYPGAGDRKPEADIPGFPTGQVELQPVA